MKINVGDYARTKYGIGKITNIEKNPYGKKTIYELDKAIFNVYDLQNGELACLNPLIDEMSDRFDTHFGDEKEIIKISPNIIDLIEIKDFVTFQCISYDYDFEYMEQYTNQISSKEELEGFKEAVENEDLKLISIVTKEQFSQMEYRINE